MKKINIKKIDYLKLDSKELEDLLKFKMLQAGVNPEYLDQLSTLLKRDLKATKDTDDYNKNLISESIDSILKVFMDGGLSSIESGEYIKINERIMQNIHNGDHFRDLQESQEIESYSKFPFSEVVFSEIRAKYLLQTSLKDSFKSLMLDFEQISDEIISIEDKVVFQDAIKKAEERIFKNPLKFPAPPSGYEQGILRRVTEEERKENGVPANFLIDERYDNHDLLALKDLILLLKGEKISPISVGPSFFAKYMPEIKDLGYAGVLIECQNNFIKKIKLTKVPNGNIGYSPISAALQIVFNKTFEVEILAPVKGKKSVPFKIKNRIKDIFSNENTFFIITDGCVSFSSNKKPYEYESFSNNDSTLKSGEVFFFGKDENNKIVQTRICFVPYDYSALNIRHQHGSAVYGCNDQTFHSCYLQNSKISKQLIESYRTFWKNLIDSKQKDYGDAFSPAVIAARLHNFLKEEDKISDPSEIFKEKNIIALNSAICSISEQTDFTRQWTLQTLDWENSGYSEDVLKEIEKMSEHEAPLNRRWLLKKYLEDNSGLTTEKQPTYYIQLAEKLEQNKYTESFEILLKIQEMKKQVENGISFEKALESIFK